MQAIDRNINGPHVREFCSQIYSVIGGRHRCVNDDHLDSLLCSGLRPLCGILTVYNAARVATSIHSAFRDVDSLSARKAMLNNAMFCISVLIIIFIMVSS